VPATNDEFRPGSRRGFFHRDERHRRRTPLTKEKNTKAWRGEMTMMLVLPFTQRRDHRGLAVTARLCPQEPHRFRWAVHEASGLLVAQAAMSFATEAEAFRAGNAAARFVRRKASCEKASARA